jgi:hypothetical protein
MIICVGLIVYDIISFFIINEKTGRLIDSPLWVNDLVIVFFRTIAYLAWAGPIFYLFWPNILGKKARDQMRSENKMTIAGHTLPSGLFS